jgi:hypothetical protein
MIFFRAFRVFVLVVLFVVYMGLFNRRVQLPGCRTPRWSILVLAGVALLNASCRDEAHGARTPAVVWRTLGSWSGRGSMQTEPFISDTGSLRLRWETMNEAVPGTGIFRVTVHSDVSGRALVLAVDARGVGRDTTYVSEDPRSFFLAVESANLDWTVAAEEGVAATAGPVAK